TGVQTCALPIWRGRLGGHRRGRRAVHPVRGAQLGSARPGTLAAAAEAPHRRAREHLRSDHAGDPAGHGPPRRPCRTAPRGPLRRPPATRPGASADRRPTHALLTGAFGILACSVLLAVLARYAPAAVPLVLLLGVAGFVLNPAIYGRVFAIAAPSRTIEPAGGTPARSRRPEARGSSQPEERPEDASATPISSA